jgi:release factor glutamine methyltransferase
VATWRVALADASAKLGNPMDARRLVEVVIGQENAYHRLMDDTASASELARLQALVQRRAAGEPLQHVLGGWGFRTLDVTVDRRALVPRPETEIVTEHALLELDRLSLLWPGESMTAVDLGTGSGVIALSLAAERPGLRVLAVDRSRDALDLAAENKARLARDVAARVDLLEGDWFAALPATYARSLALVVANPPYLSEAEWQQLDAVVRDYDPREALVAGPTGLEAITRIVNESPAWIRPGGALVIEIAPHQARAALSFVDKCGHDYAAATIERDLSERDRVLVARLASQ